MHVTFDGHTWIVGIADVQVACEAMKNATLIKGQYIILQTGYVDGKQAKHDIALLEAGRQAITSGSSAVQSVCLGREGDSRASVTAE
jgi:hypothetical protein